MAGPALRCSFCVHSMLKKFHKIDRHFFPQRLLTTTATTPAAWNYQWKPSPYPKTQAEREAAAKKYGLRVEDYEPYDPYKDPGYGDYPKVGWIGASHKDPYQDYDFPHMGTDYKEVLHPDADLATYDRTFMALFFIGFMATIYSIHFISVEYGWTTHMPMMPKQYPDNLWIQRGRDPKDMPKVVHYTFEPASSS
ncbi:NDUFB8 [Bugula neritina]|uniref:NDUFB8 n=1 Tax=Bugula neritina TaxID=10212 RepID=A0A7J7JLE5_BUGNE|nr:NDUFB8 [Bugula neritina]